MLRCFMVALAVSVVVAGMVRADDKPNFDTATLPEKLPAEKSINGKSMVEMLDKVKELWPTIVFAKDGKPVEYTASIETDLGDVTVEFFPQDAPNHVRSFICLVKAGYFDGLIFHRCFQGFMIQGGCPLGNGSGGPGYRLKAEFNGREHDKGVLSAARSDDPDSAGSQFYICLSRERTAHLDRQYTVFGKATKGMEVVEKIAAKPGDRLGRAQNPVKIKKVTVKIKES